MRVLALAAAQAQPLRFEVASIKPSPPANGMIVTCRGGPETKDPGLWTCQYLTLANLVSNAFDLRYNELNAPAWMNDERFHITAKVPRGATREQLREMMQNLLIDRFGLKFHREKKELQAYELVVAKGGRSSTSPPPRRRSRPRPPTIALRSRPAPRWAPTGFPSCRRG